MSKQERQPLVYYVGWLGRKNLGDEALYQAFYALSNASWDIHNSRSIIESVSLFLKSKKQNSYPTLSLSETEDTSSKRDFLKILYRGFSKIAKNTILAKPLMFYAQQAKAGFLGGGTLIYGSSYLRPLQKLLYHGKPLYAFGSGVMDPEFWRLYSGFSQGQLEEWDEILLRFKKVLVRGVDSKAILANRGIPATVVGDPALLFSSEKLFQLPRKKKLGINIGHCRHILWGNNEEKVFQTVADAAKNLLKYGWKINLFCIYNEDLKIIVRLQKFLGLSDEHIIQEYDNPERYINYIEGCDVFLGLKLHSVVFPFCRGVPSVMMEYRPKCRDFMKTLGAEERCLRCDQITSNVLIEHVYNAYENAFILQKEQINNSNILSNKLMQEVAVIFQDLQQL